MINLFKKQQQREVTVIEPKANLRGKTSNQIVEEIHAEFDSVEDRLLQQALLILNELKITPEMEVETKAKRLSILGFTNTPSVKQADEIIREKEKVSQQIVKTKSDAELIQHYKFNYPTLRFLTEDELDKICKKYGLIYAPVKNFIKDVPDKNIREIETAPLLKVEDREEPNYITVKINEFWDNVPNEIKEALKNEIKYTGFVTSKHAPAESDLRAIVAKTIQSSYTGFIYRKATVKKVDRSSLFICAPPTYFDLKDLSKEGELGYYQVQEYEISDPIVFRYCKGGIQVISKWGLEASDEMILNPIDN